jgi:hypothetical protein
MPMFEIFSSLLLWGVAGIVIIISLFPFGDMRTIERKELRILIGKLLGMGYFPTQVSKILDLYL